MWEVESEWPKSSPELSYDFSDVDREIKKIDVKATIAGTSTQEGGADGVNKQISYHSSWFTLKRSVAWILKVCKELLQRVHRRSIGTDHGGQSGSNQDQLLETLDSCCLEHISVQDMNDAEKAILAFVQQQVFAVEIDTLRKECSHVKMCSNIRKLDPVVDDGLLRVGGRLHEANMPMESKHLVYTAYERPCV